MSARPRTIALVAAALLAPGAAAHAQATDGTIVSVAGTTSGFAGDGGPATQSKMNTPSDVAFLSDGSFVVADFGNDRVRRVAPNGIIATDTGGLDRPRGVTAFPDGGYLIADTFNDRIVRVFADGSTGPVAAGPLSQPSDTFVMHDSAILVADTGNGRIRKVDPMGLVTTVVDQLDQPRDVAVGSDGAILVADTGNDRIVRVAPDGTRTVVAGTGAGGLSGDGDPARTAQVSAPSSVAALPNGGFVFADTGNDRVRRVTPLGAIFTVAGTTQGESGNGGQANAAQLDHPGAITLAPGGGFLVADTDNQEVRRVSDIGAVPPAVVGRSVGVAPAAGAVTVQPLGLPGHLPLNEEDLVPLSSAVDATKGRIQVATAVDASGAQQRAELYDGSFTVLQGAGAQPFTNFRLPPLTGCGTRAAASASRASIAAKKKKRKKSKNLWVSEKGGRWRSSTGSTSASAIGTLWHTALLCEGTRVTVREGIVRVRDKRRGRNRLVRAGQSFLVRTTGARRGQ